MAALCVVLMAIVTLDHTRSAHGAPSAPYSIAFAISAQQGQDGQREAPSPGQGEQHGCAVHDNVAPSGQVDGILIQAVLRLSLPLTSDQPPESMPVRLDRPPKAIAIV